MLALWRCGFGMEHAVAPDSARSVVVPSEFLWLYLAVACETVIVCGTFAHDTFNDTS